MGTTHKPFWPLLLALSALAFVLGAGLSLYQDQERFNELGGLTQSHLTYALQLKDDMAVIDWAKALERLSSVVVFQTKGTSESPVQGGNQALFPATVNDGLTYHFPFQWYFHSTGKSNGSPFELTIVFQDQTNCLLGGLLSLLVALLTGLMTHVFRPASMEEVPPQTAPLPKPTPVPVTLVPTLSLAQGMTLILDRDYIICQVSPQAAQTLGRNPTQLLNSHFLDLLPDPTVMKAMNEGLETKLLKPFPSHPDLSAHLKLIENGFALHLEQVSSAEKA